MQKKLFPKVLIISHNPFSNENNMGKTLAAMFSLFPKENLAQLYLHNGKPTSNVCQNYYSFSDADALKSTIFRWNKGKVYKDIDFSREKHTYYSNGAYKLGKKKHPLIYFCRDLIWKFSNLFNRDFQKWICDFNPDVVFFASGDYIYSYKIALKISKKYNIPLTTYCVDDYYLFCKYENDFLGKLYFKKFLKCATNTIKESKTLFVISELMKKEYDAKFSVDSIVLYSPITINDNLNIDFSKKTGISYIGGLSLGREKTLVQLGNAIKNNQPFGIKELNVYSAEFRDEILSLLTAENGINYLGKLDGSKVNEVIKNSKAVIHVESFDDDNVKRTRLSVSTKIAESIASGTLLVAYGPQNVASMLYLKENNAAIVSDDIDEIISLLSQCLSDEKIYFSYINNSFKLAKLNHSSETVTVSLVKGLCDVNII